MKSYIRIGVFKIKTLYLLIGLLLSFILVIIAFTLKTNQSQETDQYKQVVSSIKVNNGQVNQIINYRYDGPDILASLDSYQGALIDNIGYCQSLVSAAPDGTEGKPDDTADKNVASQFDLFCRDYKTIADYAFKVSKATNQFLKYSPDANKNNLSDINEIIGYTLTDLKKLKTHEYQDPALDEQITGLQNLQQQIDKISPNPSQPSLDKFYKNFENQKINIFSARTYYWNNSVRIDSLSRSIDRLEKLIDSR